MSTGRCEVADTFSRARDAFKPKCSEAVLSMITPFQFFEYVVLVIGGLLPIMNPFSTAPLLLALTANLSPAERSRQVTRACIYAFAILAVFLLAGRFIISFFSISLPGIRVAGGLLISILGARMIFPGPPSEGTSVSSDVSFSPLAMPSLAGPGSISVVLATSAQIPDEKMVIGYVIVLIGIAITTLISWIVLKGSAALTRFLGAAGIDALTRIFGFLLVCIGVQLVLVGIGDFYLPLLKASQLAH
jgi:multiple antibiotic resistance protein